MRNASKESLGEQGEIPDGLLPSLALTNPIHLIRQGEVMRSTMRAAVLMTFAGLFVPGSANATPYTPGPWQWSNQNSYYYRKCTFQNGHYFYAVYKSSVTRNYIFCYNPYTKRYWCACPTVYNHNFTISSTFIRTFILIRNVSFATSVETASSSLAASTQNSVGMKGGNGQPVATIDSMPTDLPPG